jgi:hypothetical protein
VVIGNARMKSNACVDVAVAGQFLNKIIKPLTGLSTIQVCSDDMPWYHTRGSPNRAEEDAHKSEAALPSLTPGCG